MVLRDNIIDFRAAARPVKLTVEARRTVAECRRVAERALPTLMNALFEKLDDALYQLADKSESNQLQTAYFAAMRTLRMQRGAMHKHFVSGVLEDFDSFWTRGPRNLAPDATASDDAREDEFSLVENEELEESLAVTNLITKGENRYQRELFLMDRVFAFLMERDEVDLRSNPLAPAGVCSRFREAMEPVETEMTVRLVVYKLFDRHVMNYFGGVYEEVNGLLTRSGIVPKNLSHGPVRRSPAAPALGAVRHPAAQPEASRRDAAVDEAEAHPGRIHQNEAAATGDEVPGQSFGVLQELLGRYRSPEGRQSAPAAGGVQVVATPELLGVLSSLQQANMGFLSQGAEQGNLRARVFDEIKRRAADDGQALDGADEDTLDVISMLFDFILESKHLPDAIKALISRLQIPMLKVAIMDKTFFSRKLHPARRLLNSLANAALGWSDDGDRSETSLYGRIESIVERVVSGFDEDPTFFDELNEEFTGFMERERRGAEIAEERTKQVTRGKEQLRVAKTVVGDEVARRLRKHPGAPPVVRELIEDGWKDVLLLNYLRQGPDSEEWQQNLTLTDLLLWSVEPKNEYADRQELLRSIPELLRKLREGLNGISFDQHKMARLFKELQACHIACLRGASVAAAAPKESVIPARDEASSVVDADKDDPILHDEFMDKAESMAVGTWLELQEEDGRSVRIKLSWKSDVSQAYVFVNRKGVKVHEMTMAGVAKLLREGIAQVIQDAGMPIMDRALDIMVKTLKSKQAVGA